MLISESHIHSAEIWLATHATYTHVLAPRWEIRDVVNHQGRCHGVDWGWHVHPTLFDMATTLWTTDSTAGLIKVRHFTPRHQIGLFELGTLLPASDLDTEPHIRPPWLAIGPVCRRYKRWYWSKLNWEIRVRCVLPVAVRFIADNFLNTSRRPSMGWQECPGTSYFLSTRTSILNPLVRYYHLAFLWKHQRVNWVAVIADNDGDVMLIRWMLMMQVKRNDTCIQAGNYARTATACLLRVSAAARGKLITRHLLQAQHGWTLTWYNTPEVGPCSDLAAAVAD